MGVRGRAIGRREMAEALIKARGLQTVAAGMLGCDWSTVRRYVQQYPECAEAINLANNALGDLAETKLVDNITNGDQRAIEFYLKTKQRDRGYTDKTQVELTGAAGGPVRLEVSGFLDALAVAEAGAVATAGAGVDPAPDVPDAG
jgi:hypothetical protein